MSDPWIRRLGEPPKQRARWRAVVKDSVGASSAVESWSSVRKDVHRSEKSPTARSLRPPKSSRTLRVPCESPVRV